MSTRQTINKCYLFNLTLILVLSLFLFSSAQAQWTKSFIDMQADGAILPATVADIQNDGDADVLVPIITDFNNLTGELLWYEAPNWTRHVIGNELGMSKTIDLSGDNKLDIVAANYTSGEVVWYEAPSWTRHVIASGMQGAANVEVIDMDNDNDMDVVAAGLVSGIVWYEAPNWTMHTIIASTEAIFFITVDIDSDNDIDVIRAHDDGIYLYEAPTWNVHSITEVPDGRNQIAAGDLDGDLDVLASEAGANEVVFYENPSWTRHVVDNLVDAFGVAIVDLDKDNDLDIVACGQGNETVAGTVAWYESPGWTKHSVDDSLAGASGLTVNDVNGDSMPDIVVCAETDGQVVLYTSPLVSGVSEDITSKIPNTITLLQNYPNPFNPTTTIHFALPKSSLVTLRIYNLLGQKIETLINEQKPAGEYKVNWAPANLPSGIYLYRLQAGEFDESRKLMLLK